MAQSGSASALGAEGRWFESSISDQPWSSNMEKVKKAMSVVRNALDELDEAIMHEQSGIYKDSEGTLRWKDTDQPLESQLWNTMDG